MTQEEVIPMAVLAKVYIKIRSKMAALTQEYESQISVLEAQRKELTSAMKEQMLALQSTSLKTDNGLIVMSKHTKYWTGDWSAMHEFMVTNNCPYLLEKRLSQKATAEFLAEHPGVLPPGLNSETEYIISVKKPT